MTTFPGSPRLLKGGIVLLDPQSSAVQRIISLQYNPDSVSRTLQVQGTSEGGDRSEPLRITAPPVETIKLDAEIDLTDQLEFPDQNRTAVEQGLYPYLATLETIIYPTSGQLQGNQSLSMAGMLEIIPMQAPLAVFVWSKNRVVPVRITEFSVTEEAFDPMLNPIRAKVSLGMRVLTVYDLGFSHKGGNVFMAYLQQKERLATMSQAGSFGALGITGIP
jgi:hypothetical protein